MQTAFNFCAGHLFRPLPLLESVHCTHTRSLHASKHLSVPNSIVGRHREHSNSSNGVTATWQRGDPILTPSRPLIPNCTSTRHPAYRLPSRGQVAVLRSLFSSTTLHITLGYPCQRLGSQCRCRRGIRHSPLHRLATRLLALAPNPRAIRTRSLEAEYCNRFRVNIRKVGEQPDIPCYRSPSPTLVSSDQT